MFFKKQNVIIVFTIDVIVSLIQCLWCSLTSKPREEMLDVDTTQPRKDTHGEICIIPIDLKNVQFDLHFEWITRAITILLYQQMHLYSPFKTD